MSSTKIVVVVLILIGLLFVIFVARGAFRNEPAQPKGKQQLESSAKKTKPPGWTNRIKGLFTSLQPKALTGKVYSSSTPKDTIPPDEKQPFRTVTFHLLSGTAEISYKDDTPIESGSPLKDMDNPQPCKLPQDPDPDISDPNRCSILALKRGGTLTFKCTGTSACRVKVE
jgi:hypothetical protein